MTDQAEPTEGGGNPPSQPPTDPLVGRTIDRRYEVESVLGEGGMGLVYKARHVGLNKTVALKVLRPDVSKNEEIITRFQQEAQSAAALGNEHIIDISDFGSLPDGSTYFVMEFLDGSDLTHAIEEQRPFPPGRSIHIARQICMALGAAHDAGIVHRDLKPDNVILITRGARDDFVKVLDFGIAKVGGGSSKLTRAGQVFGTPHYMSPEQCSGTGVDQRTDIYALGVILYEMVTGSVPFDADTLMGVLTKHLYEAPVPPSQVNPQMPPQLEAVIMSCLAKNKEERYGTMGEVMAALDEVASQLGPEQAAVALGAGPMREPTGRMATPNTVDLPIPTRKPIVPIAIGVGLLVALGIGGAVMMGGGDEEKVAAAPPEPAPAAAAAAEAEEEAEKAEAAAEEAEEGAEEAESSGSQESARVTINSDPATAEVWRDDELLGNTPVELPRPEGEDRLELNLKKAGYEDRAVRISSLTGESVQVTLERKRRVRRASGSSSRQTPAPAAKATRDDSKPAVERAARPRRPRTTRSEVLNPWGD